MLAALANLCLLASGAARAADAGTDFKLGKAYAGMFVGTGLTGNRLVDVDGFANWGNPGSVSEYDDEDFAGGVLAGRQFRFNGLPFRLEFDASVGNLSAKTDRLDPAGLDETAIADYRWVATARAGVEDNLGGATLFASGGLAAARIRNSVTDIDFGRGVDPDDSFRDRSTHFGWVIGAGVETSVADEWTLRLEGSYLDFGRSTYFVNEFGNNACGPGGPRSACSYRIENSLGIVRVAVIPQVRRVDAGFAKDHFGWSPEPQLAPIAMAGPRVTV